MSALQTSRKLFDLENDIGERNDLSRERPEVLKMMQDRFDAWL